MNLSSFPSKLVEDAVGEVSKLPSIGRKTALRLVLHLLKSDENQAIMLANSLVRLRTQIKYCRVCHHISDNDLCGVCSSKSRDRSTICVVENISDVIAIENTAQYNGLYHVLGGVISPLSGITPSDIHIDTLLARAQSTEVQEIIMALNATVEADTTTFYIIRKLKDFAHLKITTIARGIPVGGELEYTDEVTLGRSLSARTAYK